MYYMNILKNKIIIRSLSGGTNKRRFTQSFAVFISWCFFLTIWLEKEKNGFSSFCSKRKKRDQNDFEQIFSLPNFLFHTFLWQMVEGSEGNKRRCRWYDTISPFRYLQFVILPSIWFIVYRNQSLMTHKDSLIYANGSKCAVSFSKHCTYVRV